MASSPLASSTPPINDRPQAPPNSSLLHERRSLDSARPHLSPKDIMLPPSPPPEEQKLSQRSYSRPQVSPRGISYPQTSLLSTPSPASTSGTPLAYRPRTRSPSRGNMRPHTSIGLPMMQRAHSSPGVDSSGRFVSPSYNTPRRPTSPLHGGRRRSPLRSSIDETYPSWSTLSIEPNIPENEELEIISMDADYQTSPVPSYSNTFPRTRRRPTSPLHQSASAPTLYNRGASPSHSRSTSPSYIAQKFASEPYPSYYSSASSMPSTPTSFRSRSPSISSLETIEDSPDAEEQAMLEDEEKKGEDLDSFDMKRRSSLEMRASNLRSNKERKRWSVCGAERRADFSLEPIEE
jgi:hypothetical protein